MAVLKSRTSFFETEAGKEIKMELQQMSESELYNTKSTYTANSLLYPDHLISFVDKHMNYIINHPALEPSTYVANIKLMTKVR